MTQQERAYELANLINNHPAVLELAKAIKENDDVVSVDFAGNVKQLTLSFLLEREWVK